MLTIDKIIDRLIALVRPLSFYALEARRKRNWATYYKTRDLATTLLHDAATQQRKVEKEIAEDAAVLRFLHRDKVRVLQAEIDMLTNINDRS
jgi:hypothetical protein